MLITNPRKRFPYIATLVAFVAIVIMLGLGFWQLERKAEKDIRLANIDVANQSTYIGLAEAFSDIQSYQDYTVLAEGKPLDTHFYIDNKLLEGRPGFHVLVPYETSEGILILNLGWIPSTGVRTQPPELTIPALTEIEGIVHLPLKNSFIRETNMAYGKFPVLLQQVDLDEIGLHLGSKVLPATVRLLPDGSDFVRQWESVTMSPDKHLGYAVQWFGLAIAGLTVYLLSMLKRMQGPSPINKNE
ncbi:MAG: cytochrome oxidase assembly protein ShyY1 [Alphaproteobacteria bacterium]|jgi:cytochrome oxidase assembly protein ShyY1